MDSLKEQQDFLYDGRHFDGYQRVRKRETRQCDDTRDEKWQKKIYIQYMMIIDRAGVVALT